MNRVFVAAVLAIGVALSPATTSQAKANPLGWFAGWALGKVADGIWDTFTGKPNIRELDRRLKEVEKELARRGGKPESIQAVQNLRFGLHGNMSYDEYTALARSTADRITRLEERVTALEQRVTALENAQRPMFPPMYQTVNSNWYASHPGAWQWNTGGYYFLVMDTQYGPVTYVYWAPYP